MMFQRKILFLVFGVISFCSFAQSKSDLKKEIEQLKQQNAVLMQLIHNMQTQQQQNQTQFYPQQYPQQPYQQYPVQQQGYTQQSYQQLPLTDGQQQVSPFGTAIQRSRIGYLNIPRKN